MAITRADARQWNEFTLFGLSTDTKPTTYNGLAVGVNSLFLELDTDKLYYYDGDNWVEVGSEQ